MPYEVKTPALIESMEVARRVIRGTLDGSLDVSQSRSLLGGARALQAGVSVDIRARMLGPRIIAQEAKLVEGKVIDDKPAPAMVEAAMVKTESKTESKSARRRRKLRERLAAAEAAARR